MPIFPLEMKPNLSRQRAGRNVMVPVKVDSSCRAQPYWSRDAVS